MEHGFTTRGVSPSVMLSSIYNEETLLDTIK